MDFETAFDLLGDEYRRAIVALLDEEGSVPRRRLPSRLRARDLLDGDDPTRRRLRTALHHDHLPRLADAGVVTYDDEVVTATEKLAEVAEWLDDPEFGAPTATNDLGDRLTAFYA